MINLIVIILFLIVNKIVNKLLFKNIENYINLPNLYLKIHDYLKDSSRLLFKTREIKNEYKDKSFIII